MGLRRHSRREGDSRGGHRREHCVSPGCQSACIRKRARRCRRALVGESRRHPSRRERDRELRRHETRVLQQRESDGERTTALVDETAPARPVSAYGQSKLAAEQLVRQMGEAAGIHTVCLRLPMVWGPGADGNLARMIAAIAAGRFPPMPEFGNRRSLAHVREVVQAAMLVARGDRAASRIYLLTDGLGYSTREMYALICQALGRPVPTWSTPQWGLRLLARLGDGIGRLVSTPGRIFDSAAFDKLADSAWYDCTAIRRELGYVPSVTLQTGLPEYITWMKAQTLVSRAA